MGSFRKEYYYQLERICYNFRKQLRNVRSGLEQVEAAAFWVCHLGISAPQVRVAAPQPQAEDMLLGSPKKGATRPGRARA